MLLLLSGVLGAASVALGAVVAHLAPSNLDPEAVHAAETAVRYMLSHAPIAATIGFARFMALRNDAATPVLALMAGWGFVVGAALFGGGVLGGVFIANSFLSLAPFGGLALILAWLGLALTGMSYVKKRSQKPPS